MVRRLAKNTLSRLGLLDWVLKQENTLRRRLLPVVSKWNWKKRRGKLPRLVAPETRPGYSKVFLIVVDCLRSDHLSHLGYHRETTPFIDTLAREGFSCRKHYAASSWTYPSVISLLTGLYPYNHGGRLPQQSQRRFYHDSDNIPLKPREEVWFLTDYLHQAGFKTYLDASVLTAGLALQGKFGEMISRDAEADLVFERVRGQILRAGKSKWQFFYLQLGDLHEPVTVLKREHYRPFGEIRHRDPEKMMRWRFMKGEGLGTEEFREFKENRIRLYDTALRFVDQQIESFTGWLDAKNLLNDSLIIITADHGEEFWEHVAWEKKHHPDPRGFYGVGHGHTLFEELTHVPLIIWPHRIDLPQDTLTSAVDVTPTVIELLNVEDWGLEVDGLSLVKSNIKDRVVFAEEVGYGDEIKAAISVSQKAYHLPVENGFFLADSQDRGVKPSDGSSPLEEKLLNFTGNEHEKLTDSQQIGNQEKVRKRLERLGYL